MNRPSGSGESAINTRATRAKNMLWVEPEFLDVDAVTVKQEIMDIIQEDFLDCKSIFQQEPSAEIATQKIQHAVFTDRTKHPTMCNGMARLKADEVAMLRAAPVRYLDLSLVITQLRKPASLEKSTDCPPQHTQRKLEFECMDCKLQFKSRHILEDHIKASKKAGTCVVFTCEECQWRSASKASLVAHIKCQHTCKFMCRICQEHCDSHPTWLQHMRQHHPNVYPCQQCVYTSIIEAFTVNHIKRVHVKDVATKCSYCSLVSKNDLTCWQHEFKHYGETVFECHWCNSTFRLSSTLEKHLKLGHADRYSSQRKSFECFACPSTFRKLKTLLAHEVKLHSINENHYRCRICSFQSIDAPEILNHCKTSHYGDEFNVCARMEAAENKRTATLLQCNICAFTTSKMQKMREHWTMAHFDVLLRYVCFKCDSVFASVQALKTHFWEKHKKPVCSNLSQGYKLFAKLPASANNTTQRSGPVDSSREKPPPPVMRVNPVRPRRASSEIPTTCSAPRSGRSLAGPSEERGQSFKCAFCLHKPAPLVTTSRRALDLHLEIHLSKDLYECLFCSFTSTAQTSFLKHNDIHDKFKVYSCKCCDFVGKSIDLLVVHRYEQHNIEPQQLSAALLSAGYSFENTC